MFLHCVSEKTWCRNFFDNFINLTDFENSFTVGNSNKLSMNKCNIFSYFLKTLLHYCVKHKSLNMLPLLYPSLMAKLSTPPFKKKSLKT